jgi:hypothetical protein
MNTEVEEFKNTYQFDIDSSDSVVFLPFSTETDFDQKKLISYSQSTLNILKKVKQKGIDAGIAIGSLDDCVVIDDHSLDWLGPVLFFSLPLLSQNPNLVSICLNIISSYVYDIFKGKKNDPNVNCSIIIEKENKSAIKIKYSGPVSGLTEVKNIIDGK